MKKSPHELQAERFADQAERFLSFWREAAPSLPREINGPRCGIMITPWVSTPVPWFSIALAMLYARRGLRPWLVFNDLILPFTDPDSQLAVVERVLVEVAPVFEVVQLSEFAPAPIDAGVEEIADNCARLYSDVFLRKARDPGDVPAKTAVVREKALDVTARVAAMFAGNSFDHFVIPGGLYGVSSIYRLIGQQAGVRMACYDSGEGTLVVGIDDVAGHCLDVARAFEPQYEGLRASHTREIEFAAKQEFVARFSAKDRYSYQSFALDESASAPDLDVLIPLNIFDDAAGIARVQCFPTPRDWVLETVRHLFRRPDVTVAVREHPSAAKVRTNRSLCEELAQEFGGNTRFQLIRAEDPVSTYSLVGAAKIVLPCASTVGIEAAALGKRVVLESKVYYGGLGFAQLASSRDEYFAAVDAHLDAYEPLPASLQRMAWECYFFGQIASFLDGSYTPQPPDFDVWVAGGFPALEQSEQVRLFVEAFCENRPSCIKQAPMVLARAAEEYSTAEHDQINARLRKLSPTFDDTPFEATTMILHS